MSALEKQKIEEGDALPELQDELGDGRDQQSAPALMLEENDRGPARKPLESIYDVPVKVSVVLGKTRMNVATLMKLQDGAVIELDRKVGEPIDLYVNDRLIARGELVMVDGSLGVTMTEIVKDNEV